MSKPEPTRTRQSPATSISIVSDTDGVANAVSALNERLGIPKGLGAAGLAQDTIEKIAEGAMGDHCHLSTPRQPTKAQYIELIEQSWG